MRDTKASRINRTSVSTRKAFVLDQISVSGSSQSNEGQGGYNSEGDTNKTLNLQSNTMEPADLNSLKILLKGLESDQLHTYPSPNSTLTLALYQLTAVGLGEEYVGAQILTMIHLFHQSLYFFACTPNLNA